MVETNLPVIFLKNIIVFPYNEVRIEFSTDRDKYIINDSLRGYEGHLLLINLRDPLEENPNYQDLPKISIIGRIISKIELPNGNIRAVIAGLDRVEVASYVENDYRFLNAFVVPTKEFDYDVNEASALKRVLFRNLNTFIEMASYTSNSVLGKVNNVDNLGKLSDLIVQDLEIDYLTKLSYIQMLNPVMRIKSIIEQLNREIETIKLENEIENKLNRRIEENQKEFVLKEKLKLIREELGESDLKENEIALLVEKLKQGDYPEQIKNRIVEEIKRYELASPTSPDLGIIRTYIDWLLKLPWKIATSENTDLKSIREILNSSHYGLDEVKERIIEQIAIKNHTANVNSPLICLVGPPGTGKTSIAKSIAKAMNRKFVKISVGGVNDEGEIKGHRKTYIGANPGKIIQGIKKSGVNNPVFLIDEVDKMTNNYKGDPASALLDVLDKEQNTMFVDNYIEEEFDLSKVLFILTANNLDGIPSALRDRLEIIRLSSYTNYEKMEIAQKYLIPKISKDYNLDTFMITEEAIAKIISFYTKEAGTRELDRQIAKICRKIVVNQEIGLKNLLIEVIDTNNLENYLGKSKYVPNPNEKSKRVGIMNSLAYTPYGGVVSKITVVSYPGMGDIKITGSLGEVMKESVLVAFSYIKSHYRSFKINLDVFRENDFHFHFEEAGVKKDGPSAGINIVTVILSLLKNVVIENYYSMSGEITLRGKILAVAGLKEKLIAAKSSNIETIFLPKDNEVELEGIEDYIKKDLEIILVDDYAEIYRYFFKKKEEK